MPTRVLVLGSTGSIGTQTLEVLRHLARTPGAPEFRVVGLAAGVSARTLCEQAREFSVPAVALAQGDCPERDLPPGCTVFRGAAAAEELVRTTPCDLVVAAMVGSAGLPATLAAVEQGLPIALANKETLVAAGALVVPKARESGACRLLPVDSEHAALWQCLDTRGPTPARDSAGDQSPPADLWLSTFAPPLHAAELDALGLTRAILTASGGPFRTWSQDRIDRATPSDALNHPTWNMGAKVTIDSAGLMNKAFELVEAHWLFSLPADKLGVLVHPQSIVHALAQFDDGSCVAQLASPDMRLPIQRALTWPHRAKGLTRQASLAHLARLDFEEPDPLRFPALALGHRIINSSSTTLGAIVNAANEEAVAAFLRGGKGEGPAIPFGSIARLVHAAADDLRPRPLESLADLHNAEAASREHVRASLSRQGVRA